MKIRMAFSKHRFAAKPRSILSLPANKVKSIAIRYACARKLLLTDERMCVSYHGSALGSSLLVEEPNEPWLPEAADMSTNCNSNKGRLRCNSLCCIWWHFIGDLYSVPIVGLLIQTQRVNYRRFTVFSTTIIGYKMATNGYNMLFRHNESQVT